MNNFLQNLHKVSHLYHNWNIVQISLSLFLVNQSTWKKLHIVYSFKSGKERIVEINIPGMGELCQWVWVGCLKTLQETVFFLLAKC